MYLCGRAELEILSYMESRNSSGDVILSVFIYRYVHGKMM